MKDRERITRLVAMVNTLRPNHFWNDGDNWYSCPKAPAGCDDDAQGTECNCGAAEENARISAQLREMGLL